MTIRNTPFLLLALAQTLALLLSMSPVPVSAQTSILDSMTPEQVAADLVRQLVVERAVVVVRQERSGYQTDQDTLADTSQPLSIRERMLSRFTGRETTVRAELDHYHALMQAATAMTVSERVRAALQQHLRGQRRAAIDTLKVMETSSGNRAPAPLLRGLIATLLADLYDRGEARLGEAITAGEAAVRDDHATPALWLQLARLQRDRGTPDDATRTAQRALTLAQGERSLSAQARALEMLADVRAGAGDAQGAFEHHAALQPLLRQLINAQPTSIAPQRRAAVNFDNWADIAMKLGDRVTARRVLDEALTLRQALVDKYPDGAGAQRDLAFALERLAELHLIDGRAALAKEALVASLALRDGLVKKATASSTTLRRERAHTLARLGEALLAAGQPEAAHERLLVSLEQRRGLLAESPQALWAQRGTAQALHRLAELDAARGSAISARALFEESLEMRRRLLAQEPKSVNAQRELASTLNRLGDLRAQHPQAVEETRRLHEEALALLEPLAREQPDSAWVQRDLWTTQWRLAGLPGGGAGWAEVVKTLQGLKDRGRLPANDETFLQAARRHPVQAASPAQVQRP